MLKDIYTRESSAHVRLNPINLKSLIRTSIFPVLGLSWNLSIIVPKSRLQKVLCESEAMAILEIGKNRSKVLKKANVYPASAAYTV